MTAVVGVGVVVMSTGVEVTVTVTTGSSDVNTGSTAPPLETLADVVVVSFAGQGGGVNVGHGVQAEKHPPYVCPHELM